MAACSVRRHWMTAARSCLHLVVDIVRQAAEDQDDEHGGNPDRMTFAGLQEHFLSVKQFPDQPAGQISKYLMSVRLKNASKPHQQ